MIANHLGKKLDEDNPLLHAQLPEGSRLAAVIPPVVRPAPALTIRKFTSRHYTVDDLIARGTLTGHSPTSWGSNAVETLLISGGTGTGKTTLSTDIGARHSGPRTDRGHRRYRRTSHPEAEHSPCRMPDRHVQCQHLVRRPLEVGPPLESDRIILGEVRGTEARTLLDSFNTGHAGSLATIHANSGEKALRRFANLVMRNHAQTTFSDTEAEIAEAVDFVVHVERQPGRRIRSAGDSWIRPGGKTLLDRSRFSR